MKKLDRRQFLNAGLSAGGVLALGGAGRAVAQDTPNHLTRVTVGFPPGDMADSIARLISENIRGRYAETMLVDNKPGAAARTATATFTTYKKDGTEVLFTPGAMVVLFPHVFEKLNYKPVAELTPVTRIVTSSYVLAVGPATPAEITTLDQYLAWAKKDPKNAAYATSGAGTGIHLTAEYLAKLTRTPLSMVPYKGGAPAAADMIAGHIPAQMATTPSIIDFVRAGKARILAISSATRSKELPDVPTFKELGHPQLVTEEFFGFYMPAGASPKAAADFNRSVLNAMTDPKTIAQLEKMGLTINTTPTPAAFAQFVKDEYEKWGSIVKQINFQPLT